jgi:hypothetical protein
LQSATLQCPICRALIPKKSRKCTNCDSYFDWRRWLVILPVVLAALSVLSFGIPLAIRALQRDSYTQVRILGGSDTLTVGVVNSGYASSLIRRGFTLQIKDETKRNLIRFGPLLIRQQHEKRLVLAGTSEVLELSIDCVESDSSLIHNDFWVKHGGLEATLKGTAEESNGTIRAIEHALPLREIEEFIRKRYTPKGNPPCVP